MFEYVDAVRKLAVWLFQLLSESLGLASDCLAEMGCGESLKVACNYYPPCPEPHLTVGNTKHTDPTFLTVLLQDAVGGLQVLLDHGGGGRGWVNVPPVPGALIINIGDLLQASTSLNYCMIGYSLFTYPSIDRYDDIAANEVHELITEPWCSLSAMGDSGAWSTEFWRTRALTRQGSPWRLSLTEEDP